MRKPTGPPGLVRLCALILGIWPAAVPTPIFAVVFENLYTVTVPLDLQRGRQQGLRTDDDFVRFAMGELLIRVTGQLDAPYDPALQDLMRDAGRYVIQRGNPDRENLLIVFDSRGLRDALTQRNQPVWGQERPLTLLWVAIDAGPGERDIVAASQSPNPRSDVVEAAAAALREELLAVASQRGLPVSLPLMDLQDMEAVSFVDVWGVFSERLDQASSRYSPDALLSGRIRLGGEGVASARWTLLWGGTLRNLPGGTVRSGLDGLADLYARAFSGVGGATSARLTVTNVDTLDRYGRVMSYLEGLSVLQSVQLEQMVGTELTLRIQARGGAQVLDRILTLGGVLTRLPGADRRRAPQRFDLLPGALAGKSRLTAGIIVSRPV